MRRFTMQGPRVAWLLLGLLLAGTALAAPVTATLDRQRLVLGETATLTLQTNDPQQSLETDLSVLDPDFLVIDRRSETQMSIVNGRQAAVVRLLVVLEPRRAGELVIPPLAFEGGSRTDAIVLQVETAPELAPGEAPPVYIEVELDPLEGPYYVHAQLSLKVRIFYQQNLTEAAINPPAPSQASVRLLDEVPYQADRNGTRYRVLERRYAIFPERSGELVIPPMQLTGRLIERPADRLWQPSVRGRRVRIESDPLTLDVAPRPPQFTGDAWLPARRIDLSQQITDGDAIRVGEPVTRTVILDAVGLEEHMLEEPAWPTITGARIYPDQPQGISRDDGQWVLGHREFRYAVVPEVAGELVLPEVRLEWWDTVNDRPRTAVLPEHIVEVLPSTLSTSARASAGSGSAAAEGASGGYADASVQRWRMLSGVLGGLWLLTLLLWWRSRTGGEPGAISNGGPDLDEDRLLKAVRAACMAGEGPTARGMLGQWLRRYGPRETREGLLALAERSGSPELAREIRRFDAVRFGPAAEGAWDGKALWDAFDAWRKTPAGKTANPDPLDLYARSRRSA